MEGISTFVPFNYKQDLNLFFLCVVFSSVSEKVVRVSRRWTVTMWSLWCAFWLVSAGGSSSGKEWSAYKKKVPLRGIAGLPNNNLDWTLPFVLKLLHALASLCPSLSDCLFSSHYSRPVERLWTENGIYIMLVNY